jgi:hypothetical protein
MLLLIGRTLGKSTDDETTLHNHTDTDNTCLLWDKNQSDKDN